MNSKRIEWITSLRALAAMAIVLLHVVGGLSYSIGRGNELPALRMMLDEYVVVIAARWAVPCFLMISGLLLLNPQKEMDLKKTLRYVLRMVAVLLTFGLFYCLLTNAMKRGFDHPLAVLLHSLKDLCEGKSCGHMWYVLVLIGLYLLTPLLRIFVREADDATAVLTLAALFIFTILRPMINAMLGLELYGFIPVAAPYLFFYLAGHYIGRIRIPGKALVLALIVGLVGGLGMRTLEMRGFFEMSADEDVFVALYAMAIFAAAKDSRLLARLSGCAAIREISKYSFGIYLTHMFFLNLLNLVLHIYPNILPIGIGEIAFFAVALAGAYALTRLLCMIKPLRKMLL